MIFDLEHRKLLSLPEFNRKTSLKRDKDYTIAQNLLLVQKKLKQKFQEFIILVKIKSMN